MSNEKKIVESAEVVGKPDAGALSRIQVPITVGEMAFEFTSKADWVANAQKRFVRYRHAHETMDDPMPSTICIDAKGRVITRGLGFMRAEKEDAYPIKVYPIFERYEPADTSALDIKPVTSEPNSQSDNLHQQKRMLPKSRHRG
jgi:hypothetical protein